MNNKITREMLSDTVTDANEVVIFHEEIISDMKRLIENLKSSADVNEKGYYIGKCSFTFFQLPTIPRTLQKRAGKRQKERIEKYKTHLREQFEKRKKKFEPLKDKEILLYIIVYLDKKHYEKYDVDNIPKHFCDVLKEFTSTDGKGDNYIQTLIVQKREVKSKPPEAIQSDLCEEFLVLIADASYEEYLFK